MARNPVDDAHYDEVRNMGFGWGGQIHNPHALEGLDDPPTDNAALGQMINTYQRPASEPPTPGGGGVVIFTVVM